MPTTAVIGVLLNPTFSPFQAQLQDAEKAGSALGQQLQIVRASNDQEILDAFTKLTEINAGALLVATDPYFFTRRAHITALAAERAIPTMYETRDFAQAGGLASYGVSIADGYRQVGAYAGQILRGRNPPNFPSNS